MSLYQTLNLALDRCGFPPLQSTDAYRQIGAGAWHEAYLVDLPDGERLVIRLRKKSIYGRSEPFNEPYLREDYEPVGLYYRLANQVQPGICPAVYAYALDPELTFTIESYMGPAMSLADLTLASAYEFGQEVGRFFGSMHALPPPLPGYDALIWNGQTLEAKDQRDLSEIWSDDIDAFQKQFAQLSRADLSFDRAQVKEKLQQALAERQRAQEPVTLVNGDITPENFIASQDRFTGLVDPVPILGNGLHYAAFFVYCYRSYLPNLADAPRYARHRFQQHQPIMSAIAGGYISGYANSDTDVKRALRLEYFLWAVDVAYENWQRLNAAPDSEIYLRAGDKQIIAARMERLLRELEEIEL